MVETMSAEATMSIIWDGRLVMDVIAEVNARLDVDGIEFGESPFSDMTAYLSSDDRVMPPCRWLVCFPVLGSNEGWYIHIAAIIDRPDRLREHRLLGLAKTWTAASAWQIAQAAAHHLGIV